MAAPTRIMFHGTNLTYHNAQFAQHNTYKHDLFGDVQLSEDFGDSYGVAGRRAHQYYTGGPIVLVIDTQKLTCNVDRATHDSEWAAPYLNQEAYKILQLTGHIWEDKKSLTGIVKELTKNSENNV